MAKLCPAVNDAYEDVREPAGGSGRGDPSKVLDERGRTVPWMMRTLNRFYDVEVQKILGKEKVSIAHWYYLRVLVQRGELNQLELSKRVGIASTTAVPALDSLEKRGLLKRRRDPKDRRKYYVGLTEEGRGLVDELMPAIIAMIARSLDGVAEDELDVFWEALHRIAQNLAARTNDDAIVD